MNLFLLFRFFLFCFAYLLLLLFFFNFSRNQQTNFSTPASISQLRSPTDDYMSLKRVNLSSVFSVYWNCDQVCTSNGSIISRRLVSWAWQVRQPQDLFISIQCRFKKKKFFLGGGWEIQNG